MFARTDSSFSTYSEHNSAPRESASVGSVRWAFLSSLTGLRPEADLILQFIHPFQPQLPHPFPLATAAFILPRSLLAISLCHPTPPPFCSTGRLFFLFLLPFRKQPSFCATLRGNLHIWHYIELLKKAEWIDASWLPPVQRKGYSLAFTADSAFPP